MYKLIFLNGWKDSICTLPLCDVFASSIIASVHHFLIIPARGITMSGCARQINDAVARVPVMENHGTDLCPGLCWV